MIDIQMIESTKGQGQKKKRKRTVGGNYSFTRYSKNYIYGKRNLYIGESEVIL